MAENLRPLRELRFVPKETILEELQGIREMQVKNMVDGRFDKLLYFLMLTKFENVEETAWVDKEKAVPLAFDLIREVKANKPQGKALIPLSPSLQIDIYKKLFKLGVFNPPEQEALKSIWHETIDAIDDHFLKTSEEQRFASEFLSEIEQKDALRTNFERIFAILSNTQNLSTLNTSIMNTLLDLQSTAIYLHEFEINAKLQRFFLSLHIGNTADALRPDILSMTFRAFIKSNLPEGEKDLLIESALEKARDNIVSQLSSVISQGTRGVIKLERFSSGEKEILQLHRLVSDLKNSIFITTIEQEAGIHLTKSVEHEKLDSFARTSDRYDSFAAGACEYYLQTGNIDKALHIWRTIGNSHDSYYIFTSLQEYFMRKGNEQILEKIENEFLLRWGKDKFRRNDILQDMNYGRFTYLCEVGKSDDALTFLEPSSIKMVEEFIYAVRKLPESHPLSEKAGKVLTTVIEDIDRQENMTPNLTDYARILRLILYWKTH